MSMRRLVLCLLALVVAGCQTVRPMPSAISAATEGLAAAPSPRASAPTPTSSPPPLGTGEITARYDDGMPRVIGDQPVLRGQAAVDFAATRTDDAPFLIAGWVDYIGGQRYCAMGPQPDRYSWRTDCVAAGIADRAGTRDSALAAAVTFHYALDGLRTGPVVAVVRVHDPRASDCGSEVRTICESMMVVQRVTWSGDAATVSGPLTPDGVRTALARLGLAREMGTSCTVPPWAGCGVERLPSADAYPFAVADDLATGVIAIDIEPTPEALQRALPQAPGVDAAMKKGAIVTHAGSKLGFGAPWVWRDDRWLVVGNVALLVRTHSPATSGDRTLMERLVAALRIAP